MKKNARLDECYQNAKVIEFDDTSKFILFSDVHRGDNSMSDEFAHNQHIYYYALTQYLNNDYTYIELGDGDELWEHAKFKVIMGAHSDVFLLLQQFFIKNKLFMMVGNHNMAIKTDYWLKKNFYKFQDDFLDRRSELFPNIKTYESIRLVYKKTNQEFLLVHGHQGDLLNDRFWFISMLSLRYFWRFLHVLGFRNPASPAKNRVKRHKIEMAFSKWIREHHVAIICGHTHRPKLSKPFEIPYFNTGCCIHPRGINGIEIVNGEIMLIDWRVRPEEDGSLKISKKIIRGPISIKTYKRMVKL
jgi:UDP-2,3-diacylglucosamine pyrophosphatase LpxH